MANTLRRVLLRRRYHISSIFRVIASLLLSTILCALFLSKLSIEKYHRLEIYDVHHSRSYLADEPIPINIHNHSNHLIYIDVGCFNGDTIEYFIHFNSLSYLYDIITFEPDPHNYELCRQRLSQEKYRSFNIIIIPKIVWIRNEKVAFRIHQGHRSRIQFNDSNGNVLCLDSCSKRVDLYR
jgi:FkbM family methyltransferase